MINVTGAPNRRVLITGDSIIRDLRSWKEFQVVPYRGVTVEALREQLHAHDRRLWVSGYSVILLHVGTNDIGNGSGEQEIVRSMDGLMTDIRQFNREALIVVSAILPRPRDYEATVLLTHQVNAGLEHLCGATEGSLFIRSYTQFMARKRVSHEFYVDGLHLNSEGVDRFKQFLCTQLSKKMLEQRRQ